MFKEDKQKSKEDGKNSRNTKKERDFEMASKIKNEYRDKGLFCFSSIRHLRLLSVKLCTNSKCKQ